MMLRGRRAVRSRGTYFEQVVCHGLWVDFDGISTVFSERIAVSEALEIAHFYRQMAPYFSRNWGRKLRKLQKSAKQFVRTTSYR